MNSSAPEDKIIEIFAELLVNQEERAIKGSGWSLCSTTHHKLEVKVNIFNSIAASRYIELPEFKKKHAVLSIRNYDKKCFVYSIIGKLHPVDSKENANSFSL